MRQTNFKTLICPADLTETSLLDAINVLYNSHSSIPLQETRFFLSMPTNHDFLELVNGERLKDYQIHFVICPPGVMQADAWILYCLDSNEVLVCEGA